MPDPEPGSGPALERSSVGIWVLVGLVVLGLLPFFVSAVIASSSRAKALTDPAAKELLTDDEPGRTGVKLD